MEECSHEWIPGDDNGKRATKSARKVFVKSKRFVQKVMALSAIAKPQPSNGLSGKIGIFRFVDRTVVEKKTTKRDAGQVYNKVRCVVVFV